MGLYDIPEPHGIYPQGVDRMPEPGDLIAAFSPQPGRCFRMVQSRQLQATHCRGEPAWKGQFRAFAQQVSTESVTLRHGPTRFPISLGNAGATAG